MGCGMRTINKLFIVAVCLVSLGVSAYSNRPEKPAKCPSVSTIQSVAFDTIALNVELGVYIAQQHHIYDTQKGWEFEIGGIEADSPMEAKKKAETMLETLVGTPEPVWVAEGHAWACQYTIAGGFYVGAWTLPWNF